MGNYNYAHVRFPSPSSPYVFLTNLTHDRGIYKTIGQEATSLFQSYASTFSQGGSNSNFSISLDFLATAAQSERSKEMRFLEEKINELSKLELGNSGKINELKVKLQIAKNSTTPDYMEIIRALNAVMLGVDNAQQRFEAFKDSSRNAQLQRQLVESAQTLLRNYTDQRQRKIEFSQHELIRQLVDYYFDTYGQTLISSLTGSQGALDFAAAAIMVQQELIQFLVNNNALKTFDSKKIYSRAEFFQELADLQMQVDNFAQTNSSKNILKHDQQLYATVQDLFGLQVNKTVLSPANKRNSFKNVNTLKKAQGKDKSMINNLKKISVTWKPNNRGLSYYEEIATMIRTGLSGEHFGSKNMATDSVLFGTYQINLPDIEEETNDPFEEEARSILKNIKQQTSLANDVSTNTEVYIKELERLDTILQGIKKGFVIHETTKFYTTLESGSWYDNRAGFTGRTMSLTSYFEQISAIGNSIGINLSGLTAIAANLGTDALGSFLREPLESYLALYAGLIMFDDFEVIAKEATNQLQFSNLNNLHLYNLNGMYFPASYFLEETHKAMSAVALELNSGNGFEVSITAPTYNYSTEKYKEYGSTIDERWEYLSGKAASSTKVNVAFGKSFLSLMAQL